MTSPRPVRLLLSGVLGLSFVGLPALADTQGPAPPLGGWHGLDRPYLEAVHARVHPRWGGYVSQLERLPDKRFQSPDLFVEVLVTVDASGEVRYMKELDGSHLSGFDDAALDLFRGLSPLPPPPPSLLSDDHHLYLRWRFTRASPGCETFSVLEQSAPLETAMSGLVRSGQIARVLERISAEGQGDPGRQSGLLRALARELALRASTQPAPASRIAACAVLARVADGEPSLLTLAKDPDFSVRRAAVKGLAARPLSEPSRRALLQALDGPDVSLVAAALKRNGLDAKTAQTLLALLERPVPPRPDAALVAVIAEWRAAIVDALVDYAGQVPAVKPALTKLLGDPMGPVRARAFAAVTLLDGGRTPVGRLLDALKDPEPGVRAEAARALAVQAGASFHHELTMAARDQSPIVRRAVAAAIAAHPFARSESILKPLRTDPDASVRDAALQTAPAAVTPPRPVASLEQLLAATNDTERLRLLSAFDIFSPL